MGELQDLGRYVRAAVTAEEQAEIRIYVTEHAADFAEAFGISEVTFKAGIESVEDDARLTRRLLEEIKRATSKRRDMRNRERVCAAQQSADAIGSFAHWDGDRATVDVVSLLAACLTSRDDLLVFSCDAFAVSIPMTRLCDVARLDRVDLSGFVDANGLHIRWATGGLKFLSLPDAKASKIFVSLPARSSALAA